MSSLKHVKIIGGDHGANCGRHIRTIHHLCSKTLKPLQVMAVPEEDVQFTPVAKRKGKKNGLVKSMFDQGAAKVSKITDGHSTITSSVSSPPLRHIMAGRVIDQDMPHMDLSENPLYLAQDAKNKGKELVLSEFHGKIVQFQGNANVAQRQFTAPECPEFKEMMNFAIENAATLKKCKMKERFMGQVKFTGRRVESFQEFVCCVTGVANESRTAIHSIAGKAIPWLDECWT